MPKRSAGDDADAAINRQVLACDVFARSRREQQGNALQVFIVAWVLLPQTSRLPLWCSGGAAAVLLWRGWLALHARPLPGKAWLVVLLGLTVAATYATHRTLLGRDAGVTLLARPGPGRTQN